jgi:hypothetical protein
MTESPLQWTSIVLRLTAPRSDPVGWKIGYPFYGSQAIQHDLHASQEITIYLVDAENDQMDGHKAKKSSSVCVCHAYGLQECSNDPPVSFATLEYKGGRA